MGTQHHYFRGVIGAGLLAIALASCSGSTAAAPLLLSQRSRSVVPRNVGRDAGDTTSSGVRGQCAQATQGAIPLTALLPATTAHPGQTQAAYPTLWFYLPETTATTADFWLLDENEQLVYELEFELTGQVGLIALPLDRMEGMPALEPDQRYTWYFALVCDPQDRGVDIYVNGPLERLPLPPAQAARLEGLDPYQRALAYAELGLWQDLVAQVAELYRQAPEDGNLAGLWSQVLREAGLEELIAAKFSDWEL